MSQKSLVVHRARDLKRSEPAHALELPGSNLGFVLRERNELDVPGVGTFAPAKRAADLDRKVRGFHFFPTAHLIQNRADWRQLTLADVIARELLALENQHLKFRSIFLQQRPRGRTTRTTANNGDVIFCLRHDVFSV